MKKLCAIALALVLSGCIIVDDFATHWDAATPDACLDRIADALYYQTYQRQLAEGEIGHLARGLKLEDQSFLLLKKNAEDNGGNLYRFEVENGVYTEFRLNPAMRDHFAETYPDAPVRIKRDTVTLPRLDEKTVSLLLTIARNPRYWEKKDAHLYNPLRNPTCAFDDRDLSKLDD